MWQDSMLCVKSFMVLRVVDWRCVAAVELYVPKLRAGLKLHRCCHRLMLCKLAKCLCWNQFETSHFDFGEP